MIDFNWATKRRILYLGSAIFVLVLLISILSFFVFNKEPTCFDGVKNQDELGVDCGGSCSKICTSQISDLKVLWAKSFKITDDFYNVAALVENPNLNSSADSISYIFKLKNAFGDVVAEREGKTSIPNSRIIAIFEPEFRLTDDVVSVDFEFISEPVWFRDSRALVDIDIKNKNLIREDT